ncbi:unnamed protein product [Discosporangium mesarthrocarpum]
MRTVVKVALREDAVGEDRLRATFQAQLIHRHLERNLDLIPQGDPMQRKGFMRQVIEESLCVTKLHFPHFWGELGKEGWDVSRVTLGGGLWVGRWGSLCEEEDKYEGIGKC